MITILKTKATIHSYLTVQGDKLTLSVIATCLNILNVRPAACHSLNLQEAGAPVLLSKIPSVNHLRIYYLGAAWTLYNLFYAQKSLTTPAKTDVTSKRLFMLTHSFFP